MCFVVSNDLAASLPFMRALRSLTRFLRELWSFAREHKAWWIIPVVLVLLLVGLIVVSVSAISPFIYSLF